MCCSAILPHLLVLLSTLGEGSDSGWCVHGKCILPPKDKGLGVLASNCSLFLQPSKVGLRNIFQISDFQHPTLETSLVLRFESLDFLGHSLQGFQSSFNPSIKGQLMWKPVPSHNSFQGVWDSM